MKKILILVDNFYPAYRGGGPIQSVSHLITTMENEYDIFVVSSAYDLGAKGMMPSILPNAWNEVRLPGGTKPVKAWYAGSGKPGGADLKKILNEVSPDLVYLNGIFSPSFFIKPLLALRRMTAKPALVICPRGMLQAGALAGKAIKKKVFLKLLAASGLVKKARWHATNAEEARDIKKHFRRNQGIFIAANIPKKPVNGFTVIEKQAGQLRLVYLSLIAAKKNLLLLLQLLRDTRNITLDIYGPVKDVAYWNECMTLIQSMPDKIKYCGDVKPSRVQETFVRYHASVLLTKGENFGHAIYECFSAGRPVITSTFTPWNGLRDQHAGWNADIANFAACIETLNEVKQLDQRGFTEYCTGAYNLANRYFSGTDNVKSYKELFSGA